LADVQNAHYRAINISSNGLIRIKKDLPARDEQTGQFNQSSIN